MCLLPSYIFKKFFISVTTLYCIEIKDLQILWAPQNVNISYLYLYPEYVTQRKLTKGVTGFSSTSWLSRCDLRDYVPFNQRPFFFCYYLLHLSLTFKYPFFVRLHRQFFLAYKNIVPGNVNWIKSIGLSPDLNYGEVYYPGISHLITYPPAHL